MFHKNRTWCIAPVESAEDLASKLTQHTWCCCNGFALAGYVFLNDATCPDGAQEFAVVKLQGPDGRPLQVESITMSWCTYEQALAYIRQSIGGEYDAADHSYPVHPRLQTPDEHGRCPHCA